MDFRPLATEEREKLLGALRGNGSFETTLLMDSQTSFIGTTTDEVDDAEVVNAIKSVPCHY